MRVTYRPLNKVYKYGKKTDTISQTQSDRSPLQGRNHRMKLQIKKQINELNDHYNYHYIQCQRSQSDTNHSIENKHILIATVE